VALCAASVVICYADRSNMSTAILPMSEQFGWDKVRAWAWVDVTLCLETHSQGWPDRLRLL